MNAMNIRQVQVFYEPKKPDEEGDVGTIVVDFQHMNVRLMMGVDGGNITVTFGEVAAILHAMRIGLPGWHE